MYTYYIAGFLRRRQKKDKKKKEDDGENPKEMGSEGEDLRRSQTPTPEVDDEGFSKQPANSSSIDDPWADFNQPTKNFDSSSDESGIILG